MFGYVLAIVAMTCFGLGGILQKLADRKQCTPITFTASMFAFSALIMVLQIVFGRGADFLPARAVFWTAIPFGVSAALAIWVFQHGIRYGKIATSWVVINLSAVVPTVLSTIVYGESISVLKLTVLALIVAAIFLLYKDMTSESGGGT